jgi:hypothetical protein
MVSWSTYYLLWLRAKQNIGWAKSLEKKPNILKIVVLSSKVLGDRVMGK